MTPSSAPPRSWRRSTCSTSPTSSPSTSSTARAPKMRCATLRKQYQRNRRNVQHADRRDAGVRHAGGPRFNDDGVTALYQALVPKLGEFGLKLSSGQAAASSPVAFLRLACHRPAAARALPGRDRRVGAFVSSAHRTAGSPASGRRCALRPCATAAENPQSGFDELISWKDGEQDPKAEAARHVAGHGPDRRPTRRRVRGEDPRQGDPQQLVTESLSGSTHPCGALPRNLRTTAKCCAS